MRKVATTLEVSVSAARVWEVISDFGNVHRFHPLVRRAPIVGEIERGVGATRRCEFYDSTSVVERVVNWVDGEFIEVELSEMMMPLKEATSYIKIKSIGENAAAVTLGMHYAYKGSPRGWLKDVLIMRSVMQKMLTKTIKALEYHVTTGKLVGEGGVQDWKVECYRNTGGDMHIAG
ncbi:MAG: SRPBCC family protein [Gammaproteobacteria bacterium]|nr:SRPBCC family protein [Gammaproteobacteria bacterium]